MWVSVTRCYPVELDPWAEDSVNQAEPSGLQQWSAVAQLHSFICDSLFLKASN